VALGRSELVAVGDLPDVIREADQDPGQDPSRDAGRDAGRTASGQGNHPAHPLAMARKRGEWARIREALQRHQNNRTKAAAELKISRALYQKLQEYGRHGGTALSPDPDVQAAPTCFSTRDRA
jgi:transcriptional regulator with PAS, ATPase and Fis domain